MTGTELLKTACAMIFEEPQEYAAAAVPFIGMLMADTFDVNNGIREFFGREKLEKIPEYSNLSHEIPYEEGLVKGAFPYGLASKILYDDNDMNKVIYYGNLFADAAARAGKANKRKIVDLYGGGDEE